MKHYDLTHVLKEDMPVYPGTEKPLFLRGNTIEEHGFAEKKITMFSHTGTHMDAPAHLLPGAPGLDDFPVEKFTGPACLCDLSGKVIKQIGIGELSQLEKLLGQCDYLLIRTGWDRFWGEKQYFSDFPVLSAEAARWLTGFNLKGIGVDAISVDPVETTDLAVHRILLAKEMVIVENLAGLEKLQESGFHFSAYPLKIESADGSPVRAIAHVEEL